MTPRRTYGDAPRPTPEPGDFWRQVAVTVGTLIAFISALFAVGLRGGLAPQYQHGGTLSPDGSLLAPHFYAFGLWPIIYTGIGIYTIYQWGRHGHGARHRKAAVYVALSGLLNGTWLLLAQTGFYVGSAVVIALLTVAVGRVLRQFTVVPSTSRVEKVLADGTFGAYLGWLITLVSANIAAVFVEHGLRPRPTVGAAIAIVVVCLEAAIALLLILRIGRRWAFSLGVGWGLLWVGAARIWGEPNQVIVGILALTAALFALVAPSLVPLTPRGVPRETPADSRHTP